MAFLCNSCFSFMDTIEMPESPSILTSCFHILCNACSQKINNNQCKSCSQPCKVVPIGKDMPLMLRAYFEKPLTNIEKAQRQLRFLRQQEEFVVKLKRMAAECQQRKEQHIQKVLQMEQKAKAEEQRMKNVLNEKMVYYRKVKEKHEKLSTEERRFRKYFADNGFPTDKNMSADSGMYSFEKSTSRFEH